jgi:hypothetical protein
LFTARSLVESPSPFGRVGVRVQQPYLTRNNIDLFVHLSYALTLALSQREREFLAQYSTIVFLIFRIHPTATS